MEYFRKPETLPAVLLQISLNPCCNGILSKVVKQKKKHHEKFCLNPCCIGILSKEITGWDAKQVKSSLNPCCNGILSKVI